MKQSSTQKINKLIGRMALEIYDNVPSLQSDLFKKCIQDSAKKCALICVTEELDSLNRIVNTTSYTGKYTKQEMAVMQRLTELSEIKEELEKL